MLAWQMVLLSIFVIFPIIMLIFSLIMSYVGVAQIMLERANQYEILSKGKRVGFLVGSLHAGFGEDEIAALRDRYRDMMLRSNKFIFEAKLPHWTKLTPGVEKILLEHVDKANIDIDKNIFALEELAYQQAMLNSLVQVGPKIINIVWGPMLKIQPTICMFFNAYIKIFAAIVTAICKIFNGHMQAFLIEQDSKYLSAVRKNFLKNMTLDDGAKSARLCLIVQRDKAMIEKINQYFTEYPNDIFMIVIGTYHLATKGAVIEMLKEKGFELQSI